MYNISDHLAMVTNIISNFPNNCYLLFVFLGRIVCLILSRLSSLIIVCTLSGDCCSSCCNPPPPVLETILGCATCSKRYILILDCLKILCIVRSLIIDRKRYLLIIDYYRIIVCSYRCVGICCRYRSRCNVYCRSRIIVVLCIRIICICIIRISSSVRCIIVLSIIALTC